MVLWIFTVITLLAFAHWLFLSREALAILSKHGIPLRGIFKKIVMTPELFSDEEYKALLFWKRTGLLYSILPVITQSMLVWNTDHSFWIVLFPMLWYYVLNRFFAWERDDLLEQLRKEK